MSSLNDLKNRKSCWQVFLIVISVAALVLVGVTAIITVVTVTDQTACKRYCPQYTPGSISLCEKISWYFQTTGTSTVQIYGPIQPGMTTGALFLPLCGFPSTLVCDISTPGIIQGSITQTSGGNSLKPFISAILNQPSLYYLNIDNITVGTFGVGC